MEPRDIFWALLYDCKYKEFYLEYYNSHAARIDRILAGITSLATAGSVAAWGIWQQFPVLWSIFIMVAQVVQLLRPLFPYAKRIAAFHYFIPALRRLTWDIEISWYRLELEGHDAVDTLALIDSFRQRYLDLDLQYLGAERLPDLQRIEKRAAAAADNHMNLYLRSQMPQGDGAHVQTGQAAQSTESSCPSNAE